MPREINIECLNCASQSIAEAKAKPCWSDKTCRSTRSYYKNRPAIIAKKRARQRNSSSRGDSNRSSSQVQEVDFPILGFSPSPEMTMVFYRDRANGPIHAIEFYVVDEEGELIKKVKPSHLKGVTQRQLRSHIKQVIGVLEAELGRKLMVSETRQPVKLCPICATEKAAAVVAADYQTAIDEGDRNEDK